MKYPSITRISGARFALGAMSMLAATTLATQAATEEVTLKLGGKTLEHGKSLTVTNPTKLINPATSYEYEISGTIGGKKGLLGQAFPKEIPLATFLDGIKKGTSSILTGSVDNPPGTLPATVLSTTFKGAKNYKGIGRLSVQMQLVADISSTGQVTFSAKKVSAKVGKKKVTGMLRFGKGSKMVLKTATPAAVSFKRISQNVDETAGQIVVTVVKQGNLTKAASVSFTTVDDTAIAGSDYTTTSGMIEFAADETEKTITIPLLDDADIEQFERFKIVLSDPGSGAVLGTNTQMTIGVFDNE